MVKEGERQFRYKKGKGVKEPQTDGDRKRTTST